MAVSVGAVLATGVAGVCNEMGVVDEAGGGGVGVGIDVAAGVAGTVVDGGDATGPQAAVSRARTDIMSASTDDLEPVLIISTPLRENNHRHGRYCSG